MSAPDEFYVEYAAGTDGAPGDGTLAHPWKTIQYAMDTCGRNTTNGDRINVIGGTAQVLGGSLALTTYGTPTAAAPLVIQGMTSGAGDRGMGEIDCGGYTILAAATHPYTYFIDLKVHNQGNNHGFNSYGEGIWLVHCEVTKGASTPSSKALVYSGYIFDCYIHDAGTTGQAFAGYAKLCANSYVADCTGVSVCNYQFENVFVNAPTQVGIYGNHNSHYASSALTTTAINGGGYGMLINPIIEGYAGAGGKGVAGDWVAYGYAAFYNNATPESLGDVILDLGNDATLAASAFNNAGGGDFSMKTGVVGAIEAAFPGAWYGPASTTAKSDRGAVQNGAGAGGGVIRRVARLLGG
jgi:hypothetical protein